MAIATEDRVRPACRRSASNSRLGVINRRAFVAFHGVMVLVYASIFWLVRDGRLDLASRVTWTAFAVCLGILAVLGVIWGWAKSR